MGVGHVLEIHFSYYFKAGLSFFFVFFLNFIYLTKQCKPLKIIANDKVMIYFSVRIYFS